MSEIKTTPEMTINVKQMLKMSNDPTNRYAAQLIKELEAEAAVMREALGKMVEALNSSFKIKVEALNRAKQALSSTAGQDLLVEHKADKEKIAELEAQRKEDIALMEETIEVQELAKATIEKLWAETEQLRKEITFTDKIMTGQTIYLLKQKDEEVKLLRETIKTAADELAKQGFTR